jgi:hypothetical protein
MRSTAVVLALDVPAVALIATMARLCIVTSLQE